MFKTNPIRIIPVTHVQKKVRLGEVCSFQIERNKTEIEFRHYLKHQSLFYFKPLCDWSKSDKIDIFPEAPGKYTLLVEWRLPDDSRGWVNESFEVEGPVNSSPQLVAFKHKTSLWVPSEWEAILSRGYESVTMDLLSTLIKKGWISYDIGANIGQYSILLSRLVGNKGRVYCIEANPLCVYFLRANHEINNQSNIDILPVALLHDTQNSEFTINYGNLGLGITQGSHLFSGKVGHNINVHAMGFDQLVNTYNLEMPDFIKIDIEGAEGKAIAGMKKTLQEKRPLLLVEVHGRIAAEETLQGLDLFNYHYLHPKSQQRFANARDLLNWFPNSVEQIVCFP